MNINDLVGQQLGSYRLNARLGSGAFGSVYRAAQRLRDGTFTFEVAVKVLDPAQFTRQRDPLRELGLIQRLEHPNLVRLIGGMGEDEIADSVGRRGEVVWFAMELAQESLHDRLGNGPLPEAVLLDLATDIGEALAYLHAREPVLVHRDIKPANILRFGSRWKLGDFGITRVAADATGSIAGTPAYVPLEAIDDPTAPQPEWDIWAYGLTLLEAALGQYPRKTLSQNQWRLARFGRAPMPLPLSLPTLLADIVGGSLHGDPDQRWRATRFCTAIAELRQQQQANRAYDLGISSYARNDYVEAMRSYRLAADLGHAKAQRMVGHFYYVGHAVAQDYAEAMRWYRLAADQGLADAQYNIGWLYDNGQGVAQDYAEAMQWYRKAADQGHANAQDNIGKLIDAEIERAYPYRVGMPLEPKLAPPPPEPKMTPGLAGVFGRLR